MRKVVILLGFLFYTGCSSQAVYDDLDLIRDNVKIQVDLSDLLLNKVIRPETPQQIEAIALQEIEIEERASRIVNALNRLILYLRAERYVDYAVYVSDQLNLNLGDLLNKAQEE